MAKKYRVKYQKFTTKLHSARIEAGLRQVEAGKTLKKNTSIYSQDRARRA